jgi:hypothetical protein
MRSQISDPQGSRFLDNEAHHTAPAGTVPDRALLIIREPTGKEPL